MAKAPGKSKTVSDRIKLSGVTISYPKLFEPEENLSGRLQYSAQLVIPKKHPQLGELKEKVIAIAKEAFPKMKLSQLKIGLRDNDVDTNSEGEVRSAADPRLAGTMFLNANADVKRQPQVVDRKLRVVEDDSGIYAGCKVNVSLSIFSYDQSGSKGVGFGLGNIQVVETGERWDGRRSAFDEFEEIEDDGEGGEGEAAEVPAAAPPKAGKGGKKTAAPVTADADEEGDDLPWN